MPETMLGLDIGDFSIKAVQVAGGLKGYRVVSCTRITIDSKEGLETTLNRLFESIPSNSAGCKTSLHTSQISFRNLTMPFSDRKKISQTIGFELEPLLPFPIDTMTTDYVLSKNADENRVLAASIQEDMLKDYLETLAHHHVDPNVVDIDGVPTATQISLDEQESSRTLLIDIGCKTSSAVLVIHGAVVLVRSFSFGGDTLTDSIAKAKKMAKQDAEALKCEQNADGCAQIVRPVVESFCHTIRNTVHAFRYEAMPNAQLEKIILTGGGALFTGLDKMMAHYLEMPVEVLDLARLKGLEFDPDASRTWDPLIMNSALALALRDPKNKNGFNFRVGKFRKTKKYEQLKKESKRIAIYAGTILLAMLGSYFADYFVLKKQHDHIQAQITAIFKQTFPEVQRIVNPVHQMKVKIQEAKEATLLPPESLVQRTAVDILRDIALRIPKTANVDPSNLVIDEEKIRLKGLTDTFNTVDAIKNGLQESSYLKNVTIASAQLDRITNKIRFEMVMEHQ